MKTFKSVNTSGRLNSKDFIVKIIFKLLLENNFERVTVPLIEKKSNLQRGGIFYHFKNKDEIFQTVIDVYFFSWLNVFYPISVDENIKGIDEYIMTRKIEMSKIQKWFEKEAIRISPMNGFMHLTGQAGRYYENFDKKFNELIKEDIVNWEIAIKQSQKQKKFPITIETSDLALLFRHCFYGELLDNIYSETSSTTGKNSVKTMLNFLNFRI